MPWHKPRKLECKCVLFFFTFPVCQCASWMLSLSRVHEHCQVLSAFSRRSKIGEMRACPQRKLSVFTKVVILSQARKPTSTCNTHVGGRSGTVNWTKADGAFRTCNNYLIVTICRNVDPFWLGNSRWNILFSLIDIFLGVWILNISFWNLNGLTCSLAHASPLSSTCRSLYFYGYSKDYYCLQECAHGLDSPHLPWWSDDAIATNCAFGHAQAYFFKHVKHRASSG